MLDDSGLFKRVVVSPGPTCGLFFEFLFDLDAA